MLAQDPLPDIERALHLQVDAHQAATSSQDGSRLSAVIFVVGLLLSVKKYAKYSTAPQLEQLYVLGIHLT